MARKKYHRGRKREKKKSNLILNMILVLALIVFAVSAYQLFGIIKGYMDGRNEYEEIRDLAIESSGGDDEGVQS